MEVESGAAETIMGEQQLSSGDGLDFIKFVENPTWKDVLLGLVNSEQLDPWNIDVSEITSKYIEVIKGMERLDLHIPANLILAAAILVRIKSEALVFKEYYESDLLNEIPPELNFNVGFNSIESVPELSFKAKFPKKRKVTLQELLDAVEDALASELKHEASRTQRRFLTCADLGLEIEKIDVEKLISDKYAQVLSSADQYGLVKFSDIAGNSPIEVVHSLLAVLYLRSYEVVDLKQSKFFGDIFVKVIDREKSLAKISLTI
ncbi:MAG: segregation/condensation protein A [Candidatus Micrarchaeota archaeon]|nr:segregation/condensation protein A [Candidatus Micrarchaeota archaeon]